MAKDPPTPRGPDAVTHQLPAGELPAGWTLLEGQYEIVRLIAAGGFGITYLARDTLGRDVAVKECFPLGLAQRQAATHTVSATSAGTSEHFETARGQFLREARMLAALRHPNVVHVQTLFEENGTAYMAMDFIHGRDLQEEIVASENGIAPARVLELARDLLGALDYVHSQSILHRDIKPQNIRIDRFGVPMLIDFGAARAETQARSRMAGTFRVVTDGYSPHEFYVAGAVQGPHSDLYALAATLHHVITGAAPAAADERASAMATGQPDPYQLIADAYPTHDNRLLHLIDRALRMVPGDRPPNAAAWLTALADAPTTIVTPMAPVIPARSRLLPGALIGALLMGGIGAGIWAMQPQWLSPAMDEMVDRMGQLEASLAMAEAARVTAEIDLTTLQGTLAQAEEDLTRLEAADGDMVATMAELESARAARDAAAAQVSGLEEDLATLAATQAALEEAHTQRNAAEARADEAVAEGEALADRIAEFTSERTTADTRITTLEASLAATTTALVEARTTAAMLSEVEADLTTAEAALYEATSRASTLEEQLLQAIEGAADLEALRSELQALEDALGASESERDRLLAQIAAAESAPVSTSNAGEVEQLRARITTLEAENSDLRTALARAQAALNATASHPSPPDPRPWLEHANLRAPNGSFTLLPRFSWDNQRMAAVDSAGGIALFNRETGGYEAHLARGFPDRITRLGFSAGGSYLIATTPAGTPNRLYDIATRREILRFSPTTVTTANRAISTDEQFFVFTRAGADGRVNVVITPLADLSSGTNSGTGIAAERILTSVPNGTSLRVAFAETTNQINVVTPTGIEIYEPDGRLLRTASNRIGSVAALSPIGADQGLLVLRSGGDVLIFDNILEQNQIARIGARAQYTRYRLSGDRLNFLRANGETWDVIDLLTGEVRGSGPVGQGYDTAEVSISADGSMIFIGAVDRRPARLLDVVSGTEVQRFGDATQGYFSFDNTFLATGREDVGEAQLWQLNPNHQREIPDLSNCAVINRTMDGIPILPNSLSSGRIFSVEAGGDVALLPCAQALDPALASALQAIQQNVFVTQSPDVSINILGTSRNYTLAVRVTGDCNPLTIARFGDEWLLGNPDQPRAPLSLVDAGDETRALDIWLAAPDGVTCPAIISLTGAEDE